MILLDTNLLTRMTRSHDPQSGVARAAVQTLRGRGERLAEKWCQFISRGEQYELTPFQ
jgi:hypothetical protein